HHRRAAPHPIRELPGRGHRRQRPAGVHRLPSALRASDRTRDPRGMVRPRPPHRGHRQPARATGGRPFSPGASGGFGARVEQRRGSGRPRAAVALTAHPDQSLLEVALDHGFSSAATFARAFRARFGMSATAWREGGAARWSARHRDERNPSKQVRKPGKASRARRPDPLRKRREEEAMSIQVRELPPYHVAYMRYVGPYGPHGIPELWVKFQKWMEARGLASDTAIKLGIGYDDPHITAAEKCRYDACVVVPEDFPSDKWANVVDLPGGKVAVSQFMGGAHEISEAWNQVFSAWLPESGYQPDDRPCVEVYRGHAGVDGKPGV